PTVALQRVFYVPGTVSVQDVVALFFYFMHFPLPIVVGFVFWLRSRDHYHRFIAALLLMCFLAFVTYLFWPTAPPWYELPKEVVKINDQTVRGLRLHGGRGRCGRGFHALARQTCEGYACQTFLMIVRASLSGSWCDGLRTLTTSAAMKRTSGWRAVSAGRKITGS